MKEGNVIEEAASTDREVLDDPEHAYTTALCFLCPSGMKPMLL